MLTLVYFLFGNFTVLTSAAIIEDIENMREAGRAILAMYYYDFRDDQKKDRRGLLSSVLFQLYDQSDSYHDVLLNFYLDHASGSQHPSDHALAACLRTLLNLPVPLPVFLIVDGLDESPNTSAIPSPRERVLQLLEELTEGQFPNLRICVTSRPEADIKVILEPLTVRSIALHDERGQEDDIKDYIKSFVNTNRRMQRWNPELKQVVIDVLTEGAGGM